MYDLLLYFYIIDIINAYIELMDSQTEYNRSFTLKELIDVTRVYFNIWLYYCLNSTGLNWRLILCMHFTYILFRVLFNLYVVRLLKS